MRRRMFIAAGSALTGVATLGFGSGPARATASPTSTPSPLPRPPAMLTPAQMVADIAAFVDTLVNVSPNPFLTCPRDVFEGVRAEIEAGLTGSQTASAFTLAIGRLAATLNDGHVGVSNTPYQWSLSDGPVFPLTLNIDFDDALIVMNDDVPEVPRGSRILSIGTRSADDLVARTVAVTGGQNPALRRTFAQPNDVRYELDGAPASYAVSFVTPLGATENIQLNAITSQSLPGTSTHRPYVFHMTRDRIAVIRYNLCYDRAAFAKFLLDAFTRVRDDCARAVIVDIRDNGGGDQDVNEALWPYLSGQTCSGSITITSRSSAILKRAFGPRAYGDIYGARALHAKDGAIIEDTFSPSFAPASTPLRATVPTYLLIGPHTFSSAMLGALEAHDCHFATLVGEETAEPVSGTGMVFQLALPNSNLRMQMTTRIFSFPSHPSGEGVKPDIVAPRSVRDVALGKDPALAAIRAQLGPHECP